ncbi:MAG: alpha/beta fold hydrolase [Burkholderiaceae bacterium]
MAKGIVLIHGAWHDHHTWDAIAPLLEAAGHTVRAIDLPGAGIHARKPLSYEHRPLDARAFANEPSPNADVTQAERTGAVIATVRELNAATGTKAVIVGHSLGGLTLSPVAETIPGEISAAVYLSAFMLPHGMSAADMAGHPLAAGSLTPTLFLADAAKVGARRLDPRSEDAAYRARVKETFYGDLTDAQFANALAHLHPDEPACMALTPSPVTAGRFGTVPRHYIACTEDRALLIGVQREMVRMVDASIGGSTTVHTMHCSHSPFHSQPQALAGILSGIAGH